MCHWKYIIEKTILNVLWLRKFYLTKNSTKLLLRELEYIDLYMYIHIYAQVNSRN